jgi:uncharacterized protein
MARENDFCTYRPGDRKLFTQFPTIIFIFLIRIYQKLISPYFPNTCRFYPHCSDYMIQALEKYGIYNGFIKGIKRIFRCHPFTDGGFDPLN